MKKWIFTLAVATAISGCSVQEKMAQLPAGVELVEQISIDENQVGIPYKKYRLDNGLTVVLHQDRSDPLVHVDVTYHVGSAREVVGRSGFAHLFEHMMFQGSQHVADEQHFKTVTEAGGSLNGTTNSDRTNYFQTVPSNQLEKMLWLESDRMGFLLPALTDKKFEVQRETVKNERAQRIDNQPYGRMRERFDQAFYPAGHPYSWPVIGWPEDLNSAEVADVKRFFSRWYGPNNATLTIGGDFDELQTLAWINQYFGELAAGPEVKAAPKPLVTLDSTRYISMEDRVHLPLLRIGFPTVYAHHEDEAALDLLANILGAGKTSIFYKNLVKEGFAVQAGVSHPCRELACQMSLYALANPAQGGQLSDIELKMRDSIKEFEVRGVTDDDLEKAKVQFEATTIFGMQSVAGKVSTLAFNQTFFDDPNMIAKDLKRYSSVTKADVMRVFKTYIKDKPMVVMSVVPLGQQQLIAKEDNFTPTVHTEPQNQKDSLALLLKEPLQQKSNFDRSIMPLASDAISFNPPKLWRGTLKNSIDVLGTESEETPTVELVIYLNGGDRLVNVEQAGLAELTAAMLNESTTQRSTEELTQALEMLGSTVRFASGRNQSYIKISSLTSKLDQTLAIVEEKLFSPGFLQADFERLKQQQLQSLQHLLSDPQYLADTAFDQLLYGSQNPMGVSSSGSLNSISALTLADIKQFYQQQYRAANAQIVVVSNLNQNELLAKLQGFSDWDGDATPVPTMAKLPTLAGGTIYILDKPGAAQSVIKMGKRALPYDATGEYFKANLMNYPLGGAFNSRINLNLREDKGYTYGARSYFTGDMELGSFVAVANVRKDVTALALIEFIDEITRYQQQGMSESELNFMRSSISQGQALDYETPYQKAGFMRRIQRFNLADDYTVQQNQLIQTVSHSQLNQLAKEQLDLQQMVMLIVGDRVDIEADIKALGYQVEYIDL